MSVLSLLTQWLTLPLVKALYRIPQARVASRPAIWSEDAPSRREQFKAIRQQDGRKP